MAQMRTALQAAAAAHRRGDNTPQPIRSLRDWLDHLAARHTCNGVGAQDRPRCYQAA
jgi:hypothetical protein